MGTISILGNHKNRTSMIRSRIQWDGKKILIKIQSQITTIMRTTITIKSDILIVTKSNTSIKESKNLRIRGKKQFKLTRLWTSIILTRDTTKLTFREIQLIHQQSSKQFTRWKKNKF